MISKLDKNADRLQRHARVRKKVFGTSERPRFNVYRSLNHIYVQVIDDVKGVTLISASTMEKAVKKALEAGVSEVVFDRGGYIYTGRVKSVADGAREAGLKF